MIVTKARSYSEVKKELKKSDKIGIISCNTCVRLCKTGGEKIMMQLAEKLKKDGFNIVDVDLIGAPCNYDLLNKSQLHGDVQIVLACDAGVHNLRKLFPKHKIIPGNVTLGIGAHEGSKNVTLIRKVR